MRRTLRNILVVGTVVGLGIGSTFIGNYKKESNNNRLAREGHHIGELVTGQTSNVEIPEINQGYSLELRIGKTEYISGEEWFNFNGIIRNSSDDVAGAFGSLISFNNLFEYDSQGTNIKLLFRKSNEGKVNYDLKTRKEVSE